MSREYSPAQQEAYSTHPDWPKVARLIAEQPGGENFPVTTVDKILAKPGELIIGALPTRDDFFAIGAIVAAKDRPFSPLAEPRGQGLAALEINPERKKYAGEPHMYAAREIVFGLKPGTPGDTPNWSGPGIHYSDGEPCLTILSAGEPAPELAIGTDEVNAFFERSANETKESRSAPYRARLVGMLFQVARLALDFDAPTPTAPEGLEPEIQQARSYYHAAQALAQTIANTRKNLGVLEEQLTHRSATPRPAIHYEQPLDLPAVTRVQKIRQEFPWQPTDSEIRYALHSYKKVIETLDSLGGR